MTFVRAFAVAFFAASLSAGGAATAQTYPNRPITMVVSFPPGGADDAIARMIQHPMERALGQAIVIENIGGAGGTIGAAKAARAAPDGYTILLHQDALAAAVTLYPHSTFDAVKDFAPIGLINTAATTWAGRPTLPANNLREMLAWANTPGRSVKVGHPGIGSYGNLVDMLAVGDLGLKVTQVPYRGAGPALVDLLAGQIDLSVISAVVAGPLVRTGKLKTYALIGRKRFSGLPDLPTFGELGHKELDIDFWHMLLARAGTPQPIIDKLNGALRAALSDPATQKLFDKGGMDEYPADEQTPEAASALLKREIALWGDVIRKNHIAAQ